MKTRLLYKTTLFCLLVGAVYGQRSGQDPALNPSPLSFNSYGIQQYGSDNKLVFLHRNEDAELNLQNFNNLKVGQIGINNTLILSEFRNNDINLDVSQEGNNNRLLIHDVGVPMQIRQSGGMELTIRGTNFIFPQQ